MVSVAGYASESLQLRKSLLICCGAVSPGITSWLGILSSKSVIYIYLQGIWSVCTMATSCLRRLYFFSTLCVFAVSSGLLARLSKLFLTSSGPQAGELWRSSHTSFLHGGSTKRWGWEGMEVGEWQRPTRFKYNDQPAPGKLDSFHLPLLHLRWLHVTWMHPAQEYVVLPYYLTLILV